MTSSNTPSSNNHTFLTELKSSSESGQQNSAASSRLTGNTSSPKRKSKRNNGKSLKRKSSLLHQRQKQATGSSSPSAAARDAHHSPRSDIKNIKLESSQDVPLLLADIISRPTSPGGTPSNSQQDPLFQLLNDHNSAETKRIPGVPMKSQTSRSANVNYQPLSKPQDRTLYRIDDFRDRNLSREDRLVIERERMARLLERQRNMKKTAPNIPGHVTMRTITGRDEHFYTRFISPSAYERIKNQEMAENAKKESTSSGLLHASGSAGALGLIQNNSTQREEDRPRNEEEEEEESVDEEYLRELEFNPEKARTIPGHVKFDRKVSRDSHFYTKFLYQEQYEDKNDRWMQSNSTVVFHPTRAKVDRCLDQGNTLNFSRMSGRKPMQFVHHDTNYDPMPVLPHVPECNFSSTVSRDVAAPFMARKKYTYTPGGYNPKESARRGKVKGGAWSKSTARPKPKLAAGELYDYDRIAKRLKERKRRDRPSRRKNTITEEDLRRGLSFR